MYMINLKKVHPGNVLLMMKANIMGSCRSYFREKSVQVVYYQNKNPVLHRILRFEYYANILGFHPVLFVLGLRFFIYNISFVRKQMKLII